MEWRNVLAIDPNSKFLAYAVMSSDLKILEKGKQDVEGMTDFLDEAVKRNDVCGIAVEGYAYYGKILNSNHFATIELIGMIRQYCSMRGLVYWKYTRPDVNRELSRSQNTSEGKMQDVVRVYLGLDENIAPEHVNAAVCVGIVAINRMKTGYVKSMW